MNLIKNAIVYKAELPESIDALSEHLAEKPFTEPLELELASAGFVPPRDGYGLVIPFSGGLAFAVRIDSKIIPASAVSAEVNKRAKRIEQQESRKVGKKQRAEIKEQVLSDFCRKALIKTAVVTCYYHRDTGYLVVPATSKLLADRIVTLLIDAVGSVKTETIHVSDVKQGLTTRLSAWLETDGDGKEFEGFEPCEEVALAAGGQRLSLKVENLRGGRDGLKEAVGKGFGVKSLRLETATGCSFRLTDEFQLKGIYVPTDIEADESGFEQDAAFELLNVAAVVTELSAMFAYKEGGAE